jgi:hypothetical protein
MGCNSCDCVDRFDLEDHITRQLDVCDMIELVADQIMEEGMYEVDDIVNTLNGISRLHKLRHDKLFDVFTRVHELDQYSPNYKSTDVDNTVKRKTDWLYKACSDSSYSED